MTTRKGKGKGKGTAPSDDTTAAPSDDTTAAPSDDTTAPSDDTTAAPSDDTTAPSDDFLTKQEAQRMADMISHATAWKAAADDYQSVLDELALFADGEREAWSLLQASIELNGGAMPLFDHPERETAIAVFARLTEQAKPQTGKQSTTSNGKGSTKLSDPRKSKEGSDMKAVYDYLHSIGTTTCTVKRAIFDEWFTSNIKGSSTSTMYLSKLSSMFHAHSIGSIEYGKNCINVSLN